jgi:hypothetical protein
MKIRFNDSRSSDNESRRRIVSIPEDAPGTRLRLKIIGEAEDGHPGKTSLTSSTWIV